MVTGGGLRQTTLLGGTLAVKHVVRVYKPWIGVPRPTVVDVEGVEC